MRKFQVFNVLQNQDFANLWLSQLISQTFLNVLLFSQLLRVYGLTHSNLAVSILVLMIGIPNLVLGALAGVFVDRWNKKIVMFFSQFIRVGVVLAFILFPHNVYWIYFLMFVIACVTQFWVPAEVSTIPSLVKGPMLLTANSVFTLTFFSTVIVGNILAGPMLALLGPHWTYFVIAAAFLFASGFVLRLPGLNILSWLTTTRDEIKSGSFLKSLDGDLTGRIKAEFIDGVRFIRTHKEISRGVFFLAVSQTLIATLSAIAPGFADAVMKIPITNVSLLVMLPAALGMIVGAVIVGQYFWRANKGNLIQLGILASGLFIIAFSRVGILHRYLQLPIIPTSFLILVLLGVANAFLDVPANTILQENTTEEIRSRVFGIMNALVGAASILPVMIAGTLSDIFGVERVMLGVGVAVLGIALYNMRDAH